MVKYCELFYSFFKIGTFTIGGGYAMIPLMEQEIVDRRGWLSREEFLNQLALSQSMPGVLAVNMATGLGYRLRGLRGAFSAIAGNIVMPVLFIITLAMLFRHFRDNPFVERFCASCRGGVDCRSRVPAGTVGKSDVGHLLDTHPCSFAHLAVRCQSHPCHSCRRRSGFCVW